MYARDARAQQARVKTTDQLKGYPAYYNNANKKRVKLSTPREKIHKANGETR